MANLAGFNADNVEPNKGVPDAMPAGEYTMTIVESEQKENKETEGWHILLTLQVVDGPYKGRKAWDRLNLGNESKVAVGIAESTLSAICRAVDVRQPKDSSELHNRPLLVKIKVEDYKGQLKNAVTAYAAIGSVSKPKGNGSQTTKPLPELSPQALENAAPWQ